MTGLYRAKFETSYLTKVQNARRQARMRKSTDSYYFLKYYL